MRTDKFQLGSSALAVAFTGWADSPYIDLYLLIIVLTALQFGPLKLAVTSGLVILGVSTPALYDTVQAAFAADIIADTAVWVAA